MIEGGRAADEALQRLLLTLKQRGYRFVTPSPRTHAMVAARGRTTGDPLRDLLGWSLPVRRTEIDGEVLDVLTAAGALAEDGDSIRSQYRVSSEGADLYLHSAYPTTAPDAVFFGPDSYRFAAFIRRCTIPGVRVARLAEIGAGSGVGAITAGRLHRDARVEFTDINPAALRLAAINAAAAGIEAKAILTSGLDSAEGSYDLIVANPPYLVDAARRAYRHGGERYGAQIALDWAESALRRLSPGGRLLLYSGAPVVRGEDVFRTSLEAIAAAADASLDYQEIDPDVWGEELERPEYSDVERIAVAGAVVTAS